MVIHVRVLAFLLAGLTLAGPLKAQETGQPAEAEVVTAPVKLDGAVLFHVRGVSSLPADTRARLIQDRLREVAADRNMSIDALRIDDSEGVTRIVGGNVTLLTLVEADARLEQVQRGELAVAHLSKIRQAIGDYRAARTPDALLWGALKALIATIAFAAAVVALWRGSSWLNREVMRRLQTRFEFRIQSVEFVRAERVWSLVRSVVLLLRTIAILTMAVLYLGFVLAQFPWTRELSPSLAALVLVPLGVIGTGILGNIPSLVFLVVLFFIVRLALKLIYMFFDAVEHRAITIAGFDPEWAHPTYNIVRIGVIAFAIIVAYPYIPGSGSDAFKGVSVFIGILFSLGASSTLANLYAGYTMIYRRAFKIGDRIKVGDTVGDVVDTRLMVTRLRTVKNEIIIIPNSQILSGEIVNYSALARTEGLILHTEVDIGYATPWRQVEAMLLLAARRTPGLHSELPPFVLEKALGDFAVTYELNVYCSNVPAMARLYADLHREILDVFNEYGVQIMTPAYEGDPETPKIVPPRDWFVAPAASADERAAHSSSLTSARDAPLEK